jgi:hypothetical protein
MNAVPHDASESRRTFFLLSPANSAGKRAHALLREGASSALATRVREGGAPIGEVFSFLSGLYFRGKLAYGMAFASPGDVRIITPGRGLVSPDTIVTLADLRSIAEVGVSHDEARYRDPLERDAIALAGRLSGDDIVVLLGSIATGKYVDVLDRVLDGRLRFPSAFVGRGDMSRGGLMLRCVSSRQELDYAPLAGAVRRGARPPRLEPIHRLVARVIK